MKRFVLLCTLLAVFSVGATAAQDADLPMLKTKVKTLAAFKNGLGFVFRSGETELKDGWARMDEIPAAALGTLWIGTTSPTGRVEEVISYKGTTENEADAINLVELMEANIGRKVTLIYGLGGPVEPKRVTGTIMSVAQDRKSEEPNPILSSSSQGSGRYLETSRGQAVLFKADDGSLLAISRSDVRALELPKDALTKTVIKKDANRAKFRVGGKPKSAEITMAYLEKCITWSPSYMINIKNETEADITLEAVLANDVEDLEDADVSFVVGYPNFMFSNAITPLSLQQSVASFVRDAANTTSRTGTSGVVSQSIDSNFANYASYDSGREWRPQDSYNVGQPMAGETNEDLYFYRQPHVTLKKGDRARYSVFTNKVPYEHVYVLEVPESMNVDANGYRSNRDGGSNAATQVWHTLEIENTTKQPWTTAPAFVVNGSMPLAQDVLKYTPPKGKNTVKLTVATEILAQQSQTEASRKQLDIDGAHYDEVIIDGTITLKNYKQTTVRTKVNTSLHGNLLEAGEGKATKVVRILSALNPQLDIAWDFTLAPGAEKKLTYQYKQIIHR